MSFLRHPQIYPPIGSLVGTGDGPLSGFAPGPHRLDESAAGYSSAGCAPAEPASASPGDYEYVVQLSCRSRSFHPTANSVLTVCVSPGGKRTLRPDFTAFVSNQWRFFDRMSRYRHQKHAICQAIVERYIRDGDALLLDS